MENPTYLTFADLCELFSYTTPLPAVPYKWQQEVGLDPRLARVVAILVTANMYNVIARRTINKHKQTDTITVVLTTVGLAQARTNKPLVIFISCCTSAGKPPPHLYTYNQVPVGPGDWG